MTTPVLAAELRGIMKGFYGTLANEDVHLDLRRGEVHSLLGENGAGKTTLCSILAGLYRPDEGEILVDGVKQEFRSPRDALAAGIGMVYQQFRLVHQFTVAENLILGHPDAGFHLSSRQIEREAEELSARFGVAVDPRARIDQLSVGEQQRVEILKLLFRGVRILILDEPTAVLTPQESEALFDAIRAFRAEGHTVVFVSHKLREVLSVSDRITVLRSGRRITQLVADEADPAMLARLMVGGDPHQQPSRVVDRTSGSTALEVSELRVTGDRGNEAVRGVDLAVNFGEIVGIAGVAGNGQRELAEAIAGLRPAITGSVAINGRDLTAASVADRIRAGLAFVPEDRLVHGVAGGLPLGDNLVIKTYRDPPFSRGLFVSRKAIRAWADELRERFDIRGSVPGLPVRFLSGGNLQRAILAREISGSPQVLMAASPTRGLDVAATASVRRILLEQCERGAAVLLISEDLDELLLLSDRLLVLFEGQIVAEILHGNFNRELIGLLMAGQAQVDADVEASTI